MTPPTDRPTLSICIPTHERSHLLIDSLRELDRAGFLPFPFEVIVVENPSPTDDYAVVRAFAPRHYAFELVRLERNIGLFPNLWGSLRRARGTFCVYLADDDRLVPEAVAEIVADLAAAPQVGATYARWEGYDLVAGATSQDVPAIEPVTFERPGAAGPLRTLLKTFILPENAIYRTDVLARALFPSTVFFWPFATIERLLRLGAISVSNRVFYRGITRHANDTYPRLTGGAKVGFDHWDSMARGHRMLLARLCGEPLPPPDPNALLPATLFHGQAFKLAMVDSRFLDAFDAALLLGDAAIAPLLEPERRPGLSFGAAIDAVCRTLAILPDAPGLLLDGNFGPSDDALAQFIAGLPHGREIAVARYETAIAPHRHIVLAASDAQRAARVDQGHRPGWVFSLESLLGLFRL